MRAQKWIPLDRLYLSGQRLQETKAGCPLCGCTRPTHVQVRPVAPPHLWKCPCGVQWAVKDGRSKVFDPIIPWSQQ